MLLSFSFSFTRLLVNLHMFSYTYRPFVFILTINICSTSFDCSSFPYCSVRGFYMLSGRESGQQAVFLSCKVFKLRSTLLLWILSLQVSWGLLMGEWVLLLTILLPACVEQCSSLPWFVQESDAICCQYARNSLTLPILIHKWHPFFSRPVMNLFF